MHFEVGISLEHIQRDIRAAIGHRASLLGTAIGATAPHRLQQIQHRFARCTGAQGTTEIGAVLRVETQQQYAVGRQARAITRPAKRLGRGCDDAERQSIEDLFQNFRQDFPNQNADKRGLQP